MSYRIRVLHILACYKKFSGSFCEKEKGANTPKMAGRTATPARSAETAVPHLQHTEIEAQQQLKEVHCSPPALCDVGGEAKQVSNPAQEVAMLILRNPSSWLHS